MSRSRAVDSRWSRCITEQQMKQINTNSLMALSETLSSKLHKVSKEM